MDRLWILVELLPQQLINGLTIGSVYALVALGYTMVYGVLQLINFAHGDLFMLGAMVAVFVLAGMAVTETLSLAIAVPVLVAVFLVSMLLISALGVTIERLAYRPLRQAGRRGVGGLTCRAGEEPSAEGAGECRHGVSFLGAERPGTVTAGRSQRLTTVGWTVSSTIRTRSRPIESR